MASHRAPVFVPVRLMVAIAVVVAVTGFAIAGPARTAPAAASVAAAGLGARYDGTGANLVFRVYSARATRIAVYLYANPAGTQENLNAVLTKDSGTNIWQATV
ncbi:MAG TPA: hypothetical protein VF163_20250, partial [Micromonosporaceae bacterium]